MPDAPSIGGPTVQSILWQAFRRHSARTCLRWEGGTATYEETARRVLALSQLIQDARADSSPVAILLENGREYVESILACAAAGAVRVPLNVREPAETSAKKINHVAPSLLITTPDQWEAIRPHVHDPASLVVLTDGELDEVAIRRRVADLRPTVPDATYRLSFTGGTTGTPKAVVQTHRQELAMIRNLLLEVITPSPVETFVAATPLSHASGAFILPVVLGGGSIAWTTGFDAERLVDAAWLGGEVGVQTFLVPTALGDVASAASRAGVLTTAVYGGAPCPRQVLERAVDRLGLNLVQVYGQAEAPMTICVLDKADHADVAAIEGSVGRPFTFVGVAVEDAAGQPLPVGEVGEVVVRAEHVMSGYLGLEEETAARLRADGALLTQDLGYVDERGRLRLVGRGRELIISGGFNVFPDDVERRLGALPGVTDVAIFGVSHERWGEAVVAAVVAADDSVDADHLLEQLRGDAGASLAPYERPKRVVVVDQLPLTSVGKVSRQALAERFAALFVYEADDGRAS